PSPTHTSLPLLSRRHCLQRKKRQVQFPCTSYVYVGFLLQSLIYRRLIELLSISVLLIERERVRRRLVIVKWSEERGRRKEGRKGGRLFLSE
ncbi:hypothetical protein CSUI_000046, partial [Cystoisospora suis]